MLKEYLVLIIIMNKRKVNLKLLGHKIQMKKCNIKGLQILLMKKIM